MLFCVMDRVADEGAGAGRTLCDDAVLRPYAAAWLVERGFDDQRAFGPTTCRR